MKMAKKVLSVVLALVMALSCFAVAASAFGPSPATYNASYALKAAVGTSTINVEDVVAMEDPETEKSNSVTAKPGDTVFIYVYGGTDYPVYSFQTDVFYPAQFKTPGEVFADTCEALELERYELPIPEKDDDSFGMTRQQIFFGNSALVKTYKLNDSFYWANEWEDGVSANGKVDLDQTWPTDNNTASPTYGQLLEGYGEGKTPDTTKWHFARFCLAGTPSQSTPVVMDINDDYTFRLPLIIPQGTEPGTYTVSIPEAIATQPGKEYSKTRISCATGTLKKIGTTYKWTGVNFDAPKWNGGPTDPETLNLDFTNASVTIEVIDPSAPTLSWDALNTACGAAESITNATKAGGKDTTYTAATWKAFDDARTAAKTENTAHACETQTAIDNLTKALTDAQDALAAKALYTDLTNLYAACENAYNAGSSAYESGWEDFKAAYDNVATFLGNDENLDLTYDDGQSTIDSLYDTLNDAKTGLTLKAGEADFDALDEAIAKFVDTYALGDTTGAKYYKNWADFKAVYEPAFAIYDDKASYDENDQNDIDAAASALNDFVLVENDADYSALQNVLGLAAEKKEADYTAASWSVFAAKKTAAEEVEAGLKAKDQAIIDKAANELSDAILGLKAVCDYTNLDLAIAAVPAYGQDYYTEDSWNAYQNALTAAQGVERGLEATKENQDAIKDATDELVAKFNALTILDANWTDYNKAIGDFEGLTESWYTAASWADAKSAYDTANGIDKSKYNKANQAALDAIVDALTAAMGELKIADADKSTLSANLATAQGKVDNAISASKEFPTIGKTYGGVNIYTEESYKALTDAMTAGKAIMENTTLDARNQADINKAAQDVADAIAGLVVKATDWTVIDELMAAAKAALDNAAAYESVTALQSKYNTAKTNIIDKKVSNYATMDKVKTAQLSAFAAVDTELGKLVLATFDITYNYVDEKGETVTGVTNTNAATYQYSATDAVTIDLAKITKDGYTTTSATPSSIAAGSTGDKTINVVLTSDVVPTYDITYKYVDEKGETVTGVTNTNPTSFTAEDGATIDKALISKDGYTVESVDPATIPAGTAEAKEVNVTLKKITYAITYKYVDENNETLVKDFTNENATSYAYGESVTIDSSKISCADTNYEFVSATPATIAAGTNAPVEVTVKFQLKGADYSALTAALAAASAKVQSKYTPETWAVLAKAVEDAGKIAKDLKVTDQKTINDAADAITDAISKLAEKQSTVNGSVQNVEFTPEKGHTNTFTVTVEGRPSMVQFMELTTGGTRSYDRYHANATIVSYKYDLEKGEYVECDELDKDLAYEVWTIETAIDGPEVGVRVKNAGSFKWETLGEAYTFTYAVELNAAVISAELVETPRLPGNYRVNVVAGPDAEYVQLISDGGFTTTMGLNKATTDKDGNLVFSGKPFFGHTGENVIRIRVFANNKWVDSPITVVGTVPEAK